MWPSSSNKRNLPSVSILTPSSSQTLELLPALTSSPLSSSVSSLLATLLIQPIIYPVSLSLEEAALLPSTSQSTTISSPLISSWLLTPSSMIMSFYIHPFLHDLHHQQHVNKQSIVSIVNIFTVITQSIAPRKESSNIVAITMVYIVRWISSFNTLNIIISVSNNYMVISQFTLVNTITYFVTHIYSMVTNINNIYGLFASIEIIVNTISTITHNPTIILTTVINIAIGTANKNNILTSINNIK